MLSRYFSIDDDDFEAIRELQWIGIRGVFTHFLRIEDEQVREHAFADDAAILDTQQFCRE